MAPHKETTENRKLTPTLVGLLLLIAFSSTGYGINKSYALPCTPAGEGELLLCNGGTPAPGECCALDLTTWICGCGGGGCLDTQRCEENQSTNTYECVEYSECITQNPPLPEGEDECSNAGSSETNSTCGVINGPNLTPKKCTAGKWCCDAGSNPACRYDQYNKCVNAAYACIQAPSSDSKTCGVVGTCGGDSLNNCNTGQLCGEDGKCTTDTTGTCLYGCGTSGTCYPNNGCAADTPYCTRQTGQVGKCVANPTVCPGSEIPNSQADSVYDGPYIDFAQLIGVIFQIMVPTGIAAGIYFIIRAGYKLKFSEGQPDKKKEGMEELTAAIVGTMFIGLSLTLLRILINTILGGSL